MKKRRNRWLYAQYPACGRPQTPCGRPTTGGHDAVCLGRRDLSVSMGGEGAAESRGMMSRNASVNG